MKCEPSARKVDRCLDLCAQILANGNPRSKRRDLLAENHADQFYLETEQVQLICRLGRE
jgi:hypothetical protein